MEIEHTLIKPTSGDDKLFNIVIPTYNGGYKLEVIINCFLAQTSSNWQLTIVSDGREKETEKIIKKYDFDNIAYYYLNNRYNDWGHTPREFGLHQSKSNWTIMTGFDNYYVPIFIETFEKASGIENAGFIFCDFVLDHERNGIKYNGYVDSKLQVNHIDIGNFAVLTSTAKSVGFKSREFAADWIFVNDILNHPQQKDKLIIKIPQTLYIHN